MRPWIQVDSGIKEHDKIYNLADRLNIPNAYAVGLMTCLWAWASTACPDDGDVSNFPPRAIAQAAGWKSGTKEAQKFYDALLATNFLEKTEDGKTIIRNWGLHQNFLVDYIEKQKEDNRCRVKKCREQKKQKQSQSNVSEAQGVTLQHPSCNVTKTECNDFTPSHTIPVPNPSKLSVNPIPSSSTVEGAATVDGGAGNGFGVIADAFKASVNPSPSAKDDSILRKLSRGYPVQRILDAIQEAHRCQGHSAAYVCKVLLNGEKQAKPCKGGSAAHQPTYDLDAYERESIYDAAEGLKEAEKQDEHIPESTAQMDKGGKNLETENQE